MKTMSAELKAHYESGTTTVTTCWQATLTNGTIVRATALDHDIEFPVGSGNIYGSTKAYSATDIESTATLAPDNLEVEGFLASPAITDEDIYSGIWDYAAIEIFEVNYMDLSMGSNPMRNGTLGEVRAGRSKFQAEMRGLMQAYTRTILRLVSKHCDADVGDTRCKVNLAPFTVTGTIDSSSANRVINDAARTEAINWFVGGKFTFTSGLNNGLSMEVKTSAPGVLGLHEEMPFDIAIGDTYSLYAGCNKERSGDCKNKFNNVVNFRGFPDLPGSAIYRVGGVPIA